MNNFLNCQLRDDVNRIQTNKIQKKDYIIAKIWSTLEISNLKDLIILLNVRETNTKIGMQKIQGSSNVLKYFNLKNRRQSNLIFDAR